MNPPPAYKFNSPVDRRPGAQAAEGTNLPRPDRVCGWQKGRLARYSAAAVRYTFFGTLDGGLEYYAMLGPLSGFDPVTKQRHTIFETMDLVRWPAWRLRAGLGEGLTAGSNPLTVTTILGHFF